MVRGDRQACPCVCPCARLTAHTARDCVPYACANVCLAAVREPDLDKHVFCRVLDDVGELDIDDATEPVTLSRGSAFIVPYRRVRALVEDGSVELC